MRLSRSTLIRSTAAFGLSVLAGAVRAAEPLRLDPLPQDMAVIDVGAAFGRNLGRVRIAGQAAPGRKVELRLFDPDSAQGTEWTSLDPAGQDGRFAGTLAAPAAPYWYRVEARSDDGQTAATSERIGFGDVVVYLGQSELARLAGTRFSQVSAPDLPQRPQVRFTNLSHSQLETGFVGSDSDHASAIKTMARFWIDNAPPGRFLHVAALAKSGKSRSALASDASNGWQWQEVQTVIDNIRAGGTDIGLVIESWNSADALKGNAWVETLLPFYTGMRVDGTVLPLGSAHPKLAKSVDHCLWDASGQGRGLFEIGTTGFAVFGPHRYAPKSVLRNATTSDTGKNVTFLKRLELARIATPELVGHPQMRGITVRRAMPVPLSYANGEITETGHWTDRSHPSKTLEDGSPLFGKHVIHAALFALGHAGDRVPMFDQVTWRSEAIELGSSAGPVTTARRRRGMAPPKELARWTEVLGFEINETPAQRVELTPEGRVRIYPNASRFVSRDRLRFAAGGATGFLDPEAYRAALAYLDYPIVDLGLQGLDGVAVLPDPEGVRLGNTL